MASVTQLQKLFTFNEVQFKNILTIPNRQISPTANAPPKSSLSLQKPFSQRCRKFNTSHDTSKKTKLSNHKISLIPQQGLELTFSPNRYGQQIIGNDNVKKKKAKKSEVLPSVFRVSSSNEKKKKLKNRKIESLQLIKTETKEIMKRIETLKMYEKNTFRSVKSSKLSSLNQQQKIENPLTKLKRSKIEEDLQVEPLKKTITERMKKEESLREKFRDEKGGIELIKQIRRRKMRVK